MFSAWLLVKTIVTDLRLKVKNSVRVKAKMAGSKEDVNKIAENLAFC